MNFKETRPPPRYRSSTPTPRHYKPAMNRSLLNCIFWFRTSGNKTELFLITARQIRTAQLYRQSFRQLVPARHAKFNSKWWHFGSVRNFTWPPPATARLMLLDHFVCRALRKRSFVRSSNAVVAMRCTMCVRLDCQKIQHIRVPLYGTFFVWLGLTKETNQANRHCPRVCIFSFGKKCGLLCNID